MKKKIVAILMTMAVVSILLTGCGKGKQINGTIAGFNGLIIEVNDDNGNEYNFEITDDTILDADHQPEEGDPIEVEYKEDGKYIAIKATVRGE